MLKGSENGYHGSLKGEPWQEVATPNFQHGILLSLVFEAGTALESRVSSTPCSRRVLQVLEGFRNLRRISVWESGPPAVIFRTFRVFSYSSKVGSLFRSPKQYSTHIYKRDPKETLI